MEAPRGPVSMSNIVNVQSNRPADDSSAPPPLPAVQTEAAQSAREAAKAAAIQMRLKALQSRQD